MVPKSTVTVLGSKQLDITLTELCNKLLISGDNSRKKSKDENIEVLKQIDRPQIFLMNQNYEKVDKWIFDFITGHGHLQSSSERHLERVKGSLDKLSMMKNMSKFHLILLKMWKKCCDWSDLKFFYIFYWPFDVTIVEYNKLISRKASQKARPGVSYNIFFIFCS